MTATSFEVERLPGARYEALIRLAEAIRTHHEPQELFHILVQELGNVVQFDAIAQFDEALNKIHWHHDDAVEAPSSSCEDLEKEETIAWWVQHHQEPLVIPSVEDDRRFPRLMAQLKSWG